MFDVAKLQPGERQSPPTPGKGTAVLGIICLVPGLLPLAGQLALLCAKSPFFHGVSLLYTNPLFFSMKFPYSTTNPLLFP